MPSAVDNRNEYLERLAGLHQEVRRWLADADVTITEEDRDVSEETLGDYLASELVIRDGDGTEIARLRPIGGDIIGALGRVDLVGRMDRQPILYLSAGGPVVAMVEASTTRDAHSSVRRRMLDGVEAEGWYWISDRRLRRARPLTAELFKDLVLEVSDCAV